MQSCISHVKAWAIANMRKLHDNKTELMLVTSKRTKHLHTLPTSITIGNAQIPFKHSVKNLGITLDCHLITHAHVSNIARTCNLELRRLAYIRRFLTSSATTTLVSAFVLPRIDYCKSLLFGSSHDVTFHYQRILNYAARIILRLPKSYNITTHLKSHRWLPVKVRSTYEIACLCYHCHCSTAPSYVTDMLQKNPSHTRNTRSSSYTMPLLNRHAISKETLGDRSFHFASSSVWNSIPNDVRCAPSLSPSKSTCMPDKPSHTRNTRSSSCTIHLLNRHAITKETLGDRSFYLASSSVWNSVPNDVSCVPSLSSSNSRLKTYLFRSVYKD